MVTYNVKQAASMLFISQSWVIKYAPKLNIQKINGQYYLTSDDVENLRLVRHGKVPKRRLKAKEIGITERHLKYILGTFKVWHDDPRVPEIVRLWKTKHYTKKGIEHILGLKKFVQTNDENHQKFGH